MQQNYNLISQNTFGIQAFAKYFATFESTNELINLLQNQLVQNNKIFILGGGSNILCTQNLDGVVLKNNIKGISIISETENEIIVQCGAGEVWHDFVLWCVVNKYYGVENLSLIPGTVGASPMQNIGAYGAEIKDVFESLEAVEIATQNSQIFNNAQCNFGYRESIFKNSHKDKFVITSVTFRLQKNGILNTSYGAIQEVLAAKNIVEPNIKDVSNAVIEIRESKLPNPKEIGNAGSFFKNPTISNEQYSKLQTNYSNIPGYKVDEHNTKVPAGWLIEQCNWKGFKENNYGVHAKQALVLVNYGGANGNEIVALSQKIIDSVQQKFGIKLHAEVNIW